MLYAVKLQISEIINGDSVTVIVCQMFDLSSVIEKINKSLLPTLSNRLKTEIIKNINDARFPIFIEYIIVMANEPNTQKSGILECKPNSLYDTADAIPMTSNKEIHLYFVIFSSFTFKKIKRKSRLTGIIINTRYA